MIVMNLASDDKAGRKESLIRFQPSKSDPLPLFREGRLPTSSPSTIAFSSSTAARKREVLSRIDGLSTRRSCHATKTSVREDHNSIDAIKPARICGDANVAPTATTPTKRLGGGWLSLIPYQS